MHKCHCNIVKILAIVLCSLAQNYLYNLVNLNIFINWKLHLFPAVFHGSYSVVCEFSLCKPNVM